MGRNWAHLGGENSRSKGFWGRWQANGCFRRCRGEGFCAGGMVARQTAPRCTRCVRTEKGSARTKRAWAEAPRTGVYVISAWNVRGTGRTGCNRAQGSFFADEDRRPIQDARSRPRRCSYKGTRLVPHAVCSPAGSKHLIARMIDCGWDVQFTSAKCTMAKKEISLQGEREGNL